MTLSGMVRATMDAVLFRAAARDFLAHLHLSLLLDVVLATAQGDRVLRFSGGDGSLVFDTSVHPIRHEELRSTQLPGEP